MMLVLLAVGLGQPSSNQFRPLAIDLRPGAVAFHQGINSRTDPAVSRRHFADAAKEFDTEWREERQTPRLALNRGRAHFLAGNLPHAIRAFRDGLALAPWDAELQSALNHCRAQVDSPAESTPAERLRPDPLTTIRHRVSPTDLTLASLGFALCLVVGLAMRLTLQPSWATPLAFIGGAGLLLVVAAGVKLELDAERETARPTLVVATETVLRTGNGATYDSRLPFRVPKGAEVRERHARGGWVQVELPGGALGWLPQESVLWSSIKNE